MESDGTAPEAASGDESQDQEEVEELASESDNGECIGLDEPTRTSLAAESDFEGLDVDVKVEIKEEEIEIDPELVQEGDEDDPFGATLLGDGWMEDAAGGSQGEENSETSTDTAEESVPDTVEDHRYQKKKRPIAMKKSGPVPKKRKRKKPVNKKALVIARFVPGMMTRRHSKLLCLECGRDFDSAIMFATHRKQYHVQVHNMPHACSYCPRMFRFRLDLQRHFLHHTRLEALECSVCHLSFYSAKTLADHVANHRVPKALNQCNICALNFPTAGELEAHNLDLHSKLPRIEKVVLPSHLVCFGCGNAEKSLRDLRNHMATHREPLTCKLCDRTQANTDQLASHVSEVHKNHGILSYHCCPNCNKMALSHAMMMKHKQVCVLPKAVESRHRISCDICKLSYYDAEHFETHMRLHEVLARESVRKPCRLCSFIAKSTSEYALHMVNVHGFRDTMESLEQVYQRLKIVPSQTPPSMHQPSAALPSVVQPKCIVPSCKQTSQLGIAFHNLPNRQTQPERWERFVKDLRLPPGVPAPGMVAKVCSKHFSMVGFSVADLTGK